MIFARGSSKQSEFGKSTIQQPFVTGSSQFSVFTNLTNQKFNEKWTYEYFLQEVLKSKVILESLLFNRLLSPVPPIFRFFTNLTNQQFNGKWTYECFLQEVAVSKVNLESLQFNSLLSQVPPNFLGFNFTMFRF